jgi:sarcosine reductase
MKLKMATFRVDRIELSRRTAWEKRVLFVDLDELRRLILADPIFVDVKIEVVTPGEKTRIVHVLDAVEPRVKVEGPSCCFPGVLGAAQTAGNGTTHRLAGMAVLGIGLGFDLPSASQTGVSTFDEGIIDMSGPAQRYCACSDTINLCLGFSVSEGCTSIEFDASARLATLKAADYLARCTIGLKPIEETTYELSSASRDLPRIAYINQIQSQGFLCRTFLYGAPMEGYFTPTLLHPNELLDGAVVSSNYRSFMKACTFLQQNNHVILELFKRHGKDLNFVGQIVGRGHFDDFLMKERTGQYASKLASLLDAQAVVLTLEGSGNAYVDYMAAVRALELSGICAVPIVHESGGPDGKDDPLPDVVSEAVSIITGGGSQPIELPRMDRVVGGERVRFTDGEFGLKAIDARTSFMGNPHVFYCGLWQMQISGMTAASY